MKIPRYIRFDRIKPKSLKVIERVVSVARMNTHIVNRPRQDGERLIIK